MVSENDASEVATSPDDRMSADAVAKIAARPALDAVSAAIKRAGERTGVSFDLLYRMARRESALDPAAKAKTSSAAGLYQFIEQTWLGAVKAHGARHGLGEAAAAIERTAEGRYRVADPEKRAAILDLRFNPDHAAALAAELVRENRAALEARLGREVGGAELYAAHFFGAAGAAKFLSAAPTAVAADILPSAAAANRPVFYDGARARSVGEVLAAIESSIGDAVAPERAPERAPETKSADFVMLAGFPAAAAGVRPPYAAQAFLPAASAPARAALDAEGARALTRLFSMREEPAAAALSPLAIAVLQALDPTRLRAERSDD
jgi:hypothetical protein